MKTLKSVIILTLFIFSLSAIFSCVKKDLIEYDGITYEFVEEHDFYDGSVERYYSVESVPRDLTEVTIPDKIGEFEVKSVYPSAFKNCTKLKSVSLPDGVTFINVRAFENCTSLTELKLPNELEYIDRGAFIGCTNLSKISIDENNQHFKVIDNVVYSKDGQELVLYPSGKQEQYFKIPEGVTKIKGYAFYGACFESVEIPYGVKSIFSYAFENCQNLSSIELPDSVQFLDDSVFEDCKKLKSVVLSKNLKEIPRRAFIDCRSLESISIPDNIESIQGEAFANCTSLKSIFIPNTVQKINFEAFANCSSLKSIFIPNTVQEVDYDAFENCDNLTIYCEAKSKPQKWHRRWSGNAKVVWGATAPTE